MANGDELGWIELMGEGASKKKKTVSVTKMPKRSKLSTLYRGRDREKDTEKVRETETEREREDREKRNTDAEQKRDGEVVWAFYRSRISKTSSLFSCLSILHFFCLSLSLLLFSLFLIFPSHHSTGPI